MPKPDDTIRRQLRVVGVWMPTPRTVRVIGRGDIADWPAPEAASEISVYLPDTVAGPVIRRYCVRDWDPEQQTVTVDFALHSGAGPAAQWAARVVAGMWFEVSRWSAGSFQPTAGLGPYLFVGDATSVPAITTCVATLPVGATAHIILELEDEHELPQLESLAALTVDWLPRTGSAQTLAAVRVAALAAPPALAWLAGEAERVATLRAALLDGGLSTERVESHAYWRAGEADLGGQSSLEPTAART